MQTVQAALPNAAVAGFCRPPGAMLGALTPGGAPAAPAVTAAAPGPATGSGGAGATIDDITTTLEKLHALVGKGILSQAEFDTKKAESLARLT